MTSSATARTVHLTEPGEPPRPVAPPLDPQDDPGLVLALSAGYFGGAVFGGGLSLFYHTGHFDFGGAGYFGSANLTGTLGSQVTSDPALSGLNVQDLKVSSSAFVMQGRYYVYESLAVGLGAGWRRIGGTVTLTGDKSQSLSATATAMSAVATAAIGNHWYWPHGFYVGVDWLGVTVPFVSSEQVSTSASASVPAATSQALASEAQTLAKTLAQAPGLVLCLASIGYRW